MSGSQGSDSKRGQAKGSNPHDDDPSENFEDDPDSDAADDAQATISNIEQSVTTADPASGDATNTQHSIDDIDVAEPSQLAGGIPAAVDDSRDDFHDIRNSITRAETIGEAEELFEELLDDDEIDAAVAEIQTQQDIRRNFDEIDDPSELQIGQEVLYDADRPKRGVVESVDADGTVWINNEHRDAGGGVNPDMGAIYADPEFEADTDTSVDTYEKGRYGLGSNPDVLENAFDVATEGKSSDEAGITEGNSTADKMDILELDDGSRVFATPISAYPHQTVGTQERAIENNLNSPKIIEALGGESCTTRLTEGPDGETYIVTEGVDGDTVRSRQDGIPDTMAEEAEKTMAAGYFTGNIDLHTANIKVTDRGTLAIIDNDNAGYSSEGITQAGPRNIVTDMSHFTRTTGMPQNADTRSRIYNMALEIESGSQELPVDEGSEHYEYAHDAAEKAIRAAVADPDYAVPDSRVPQEMQSTPSGYGSISDYSPGDTVMAVNRDGGIVEGEVTDVETEDEQRKGIVVDETDGYGNFKLSSADSLKRVMDVDPASGD